VSDRARCRARSRSRGLPAPCWTTALSRQQLRGTALCGGSAANVCARAAAAPPSLTVIVCVRARRYSPTWHVVIGTNYGSHVVHATKHFIYFYLGPKAILIFKSG